MQIFASGMRKSWRHRVYVDLFAGPGVCFTRGTAPDFYNASPLLALQHEFTQHVYVDMDPIATGALEQRLAPWRERRRIDVILGDCNAVIDRVIDLLPKEDCLVFAFVDPTNWQIHFDTMRRLVDRRRVDILMTLHAPSMKRVSHLVQRKLALFYGSEEYPQRDPTTKRVPSVFDYVSFYRQRMVGLGYLPRETAREVMLRNSRSVPLYTMTFFSRHDLGYDFFDKISAEDYNGQMTLLREPVKPARVTSLSER